MSISLTFPAVLFTLAAVMKGRMLTERSLRPFTPTMAPSLATEKKLHGVAGTSALHDDDYTGECLPGIGEKYTGNLKVMSSATDWIISRP